MKKLLALLLALLLPTAALAETFELTLMMDVNADSLKEALRDDPSLAADIDSEALVDVVLSLLNNTGVSLKCQEDAAMLELFVSGESLLDMTVHLKDAQTIITSTLMKDYALVSKSETQTTEDLALISALDTQDLSELVSPLVATVLDWIDALEPTVETGSFIGDAYDGGTVCTTIVLTDLDIAGLVRQLLTDDLRSWISDVLTLYGADGDAILAEFDALNDRVADDNRYAYILRIIEDDQEAFIGASLTIFDELAQIATLSLGRNGKEWKLVYGMGLNAPDDSMNYWLDATYTNTAYDSHRDHSGSISDWIGDKDSTYAYVVETTEPLSMANWYFNTNQTGEQITFDAGISEETVLGNIGLNGSVITSPPSLDCTLSVYDMGVSIIALDVDFGRCDSIPVLDESLTLVDMNAPEDAEALADALNGFSIMLVVRLMKSLPMDKLVTIMNMLPIE